LFSFALHRGYVLKNPVTLAERARVRAEKPAILTVAEAPALIENAEADFIPAFALGQVPGIPFATHASPPDASRGFGVESGRFRLKATKLLPFWAFLADKVYIAE
jgi:hypothetical protein